MKTEIWLLKQPPCWPDDPVAILDAGGRQLTPVRGLHAETGHHGVGNYMLTGYAKPIGPSGQPFLKLTLADATGKVTGFVWPESWHAVTLPALNAPVSVQANVRLFEGLPQLHISTLQPTPESLLPPAASLLPRARCPGDKAQAAFDRLARLEAELPEVLSHFVRRVLLDPAIGIAFTRCRASVNHHHAYPGGLLVHSTEMLDAVAVMVRSILPADDWSPYLAQVAYLVHDLGKLRSVGERSRPPCAFACRHELMTIELLAPSLQWLEGQSLELASALRCILDYLATPHKTRKVPRYAAAEVVAKMDQWSAAAFNGRDLGHMLRAVGASQEQVSCQSVGGAYSLEDKKHHTSCRA